MGAEMNNNHQPRKSYYVRVGHWEIRVTARDADEAVAIARRQLARDLPRLYDIIRNLTANRFRVEAAA
jgi:hypothetical protein